jgi:hypothetical protein
MKKIKILFIQLPLIDHAYGYINGNIEYAPAVISSYIQKNFPEIICRTLPSVISNFCCDELIIKYSVAEKPDIICFTSYLWNIERNLRLSLMLKEKLKSVKIFLGGPEISFGSIALSSHNPQVDLFISGEGEWFFNLYLSEKKIKYTESSGNIVAIQPASELVSAEQITEPVSSNMLNTFIDGSVFIEMTRGCPYRCSYCFYSKNFSKIRELPFSILTDIIRNRKEIKEIYILSPTFNKTKDFISNLKNLKKLKHGVRLHTEMRTEGITAETAKLMFDAGFRSLEVGVQSLNINAIESIGRRSNPEKELAGIKNLADAGIELKVGIIPGLPGDDPENFTKTIDTLCDRGLGEFIELYPLMILPGTAVRDRAVADNIQFQNNPPYYFTEGWNFNFDDIKHFSKYIETKTGLSTENFYLPDFTVSENPLFTRGLSLTDQDLHDIKNTITAEVHTSVTDLHVTVTDSGTFYTELEKFIETADQNRLYNIILYSDSVFDNNRILEMLKIHETDNLYRRQNIFNSFTEGSLFHFFHLTETMHKYFKALDSYHCVTPVLSVNRITKDDLLINNFNDIPLLIEDGIYPEIKNFLMENYNENPEYVAFKNEDEMQQFYEDIGQEMIRYPFSFWVK